MQGKDEFARLLEERAMVKSSEESSVRTGPPSPGTRRDRHSLGRDCGVSQQLVTAECAPSAHSALPAQPVPPAQAAPAQRAAGMEPQRQQQDLTNKPLNDIKQPALHAASHRAAGLSTDGATVGAQRQQSTSLLQLLLWVLIWSLRLQ